MLCAVVVLLCYQVCSYLRALAFAASSLGKLHPWAWHGCPFLNLSCLKSHGISSHELWLVLIFLVRAALPHLLTTLAPTSLPTIPYLLHYWIGTESILSIYFLNLLMSPHPGPLQGF